MPRVFVTERELEVLRGEADDVSDLDHYQEEVVSRLRNRFRQASHELDRIERAVDDGELDVDLMDVAQEELCE